VGSNEIKPEAACCPELAGMVQSSPECVCNLYGGGASPRFGVKLDKQRAEQLSTICGVKAPSPSLCSGTFTHLVHLLFLCNLDCPIRLNSIQRLRDIPDSFVIN